ncbi:MAG: DUF3990 domain-containing protein [Bacteroidaceae bacterium]|nr:DUF3990 domain-containing protein [Bacteroidaceae bacterium]
MILYHGSNVEIETIDLTKSKVGKDFGCGFYLSAEQEQAEDMARFKVDIQGGEICVTSFDFDDSCLNSGELNVKTFDDYSEEWASFVLSNRKNSTRQQIHPYDVVFGPIADDKVGAQIRRLENGDIDMKEFMNRIRYMRGITFQYFFGTEQSLKYLRHL